MKGLFILASLVLSLQVSVGQSVPKKNITAVRVNQAPKIDGNLDDAVWANVPIATDFTAVEPIENIPSQQRTEVKVVYTDDAIYIGAMMYDTNPELILKEITQRDNTGNADLFGIFIDTYFDQQNLFKFQVTAAGVQIDDKLNIDNFNAIWQNACKINEKGWVAELKLPYYAFRFPDKAVQLWGVQFRRNIRRTREDSYWQYVPNTVQNYPAFIGTMDGISSIKPPLRLSFTPYIGSNVSHFPYGIPGQKNWNSAYNAGMDVKYGINESFTLDATLAPDFGQVQSDNNILNLSAFETQFDDYRPFFNEGIELFSIGNLFYSRRIGKTPKGFDNINNRASNKEFRIISNPQQTQLINATKVSGRTASGLGLGVFNAITSEMHALVQDSDGSKKTIKTEPFTNYAIVAANQTLKNNSSFSLINTNVTRAGIKDNANLSGAGFTLGNKNNSYSLKTLFVLSQKLEAAGNTQGYKYGLSFSKTSGNFQFTLNRGVLSANFNPNDLGILFYANEITNSLELNYNTFKARGNILRTFTTLSGYRSSTQNTGMFQNAEINFNEWILFRSYLGVYANAGVRPVEGNDIYEARVPGRVYKTPAYYGATAGISSDYRKKLALDMSYAHYRDFTRTGIFNQVKFAPRVRLSNHFSFVYSLNYAYDYNNQGFGANDSIWTYISRRDVKTIVNTFQGAYVFSPNSSLSLRVRHYWSTVDVKYVDLLKSDGSLMADTTGFNRNINKSIAFFNVDLVYTWRFAPGSDLVFVWKNAITPVKDSSPASRSAIDAGLGTHLYRTFREDQLNTFTLKLLYFLDYQYFKKKRR